MKKIIIPVITTFVLLMASAVHAETIGTVLSTNIGTVIDGAACKTYNVDGRTFVVAEDLRGYGFDVQWSEAEWMLSITQNPYAKRTLLSADEVNIGKFDCSVGEPLMDILASDIQVTVAGEEVEGYNIDGYMIIPVRALEPYAYVEYDDEQRLVKIKGLQHYLDERYTNGNPFVSREVKEYEDEEYSYNHGVNSTPAGYEPKKLNYQSTPVKIVESTTIDKENGTITQYYGNPIWEDSGGGRYYSAQRSDKERCEIVDENGTVLYKTYIDYKIIYNPPILTELQTDSLTQEIEIDRRSLFGYRIISEE